MNIVARIRDLSVSFSDHKVIDNVSLDIIADGITVIVGRSGSGKTTFLRALNRLNEELDGCVTEGEVSLALGQGLTPIYSPNLRSLAELRLKVGMVFQTPNILPVSIWRNVALPMELLTPLDKKEITQRVEQSLQAVGLWEQVSNRLNQPAAKLSGGQQQRLCLARTLAMAPKILLLDEPTASLDVFAAREIEQLLLQLSEQYQLIMVSHSLSQVKRLARNLIVFENGKLIQHVAAANVSEEDLLAMVE